MGKRSESRELLTTIEVLDALGGEKVVAELTQQRGDDGWKNVEGWKRTPTFPSRYFYVMTLALRKKRLRAHPRLWGQVIAPDMDQAVA